MRHNRRKYTSSSYSVCGDLIVRGNHIQIAQKYEVMAEEAHTLGDQRLCHIYLNYAEHWRKGPSDT